MHSSDPDWELDSTVGFDFRTRFSMSGQGRTGLIMESIRLAIKAILVNRAKVLMPPQLISEYWQVISRKIPMPPRVQLLLILIRNKSLSDHQVLPLRIGELVLKGDTCKRNVKNI